MESHAPGFKCQAGPKGAGCQNPDIFYLLAYASLNLSVTFAMQELFLGLAWMPQTTMQKPCQSKRIHATAGISKF